MLCVCMYMHAFVCQYLLGIPRCLLYQETEVSDPVLLVGHLHAEQYRTVMLEAEQGLCALAMAHECR
jgi:hypothetical protein